jgi:hypothetical protein
MEVGTKMGAMIDFGWSSGSGVYFGVGVSATPKYQKSLFVIYSYVNSGHVCL